MFAKFWAWLKSLFGSKPAPTPAPVPTPAPSPGPVTPPTPALVVQPTPAVLFVTDADGYVSLDQLPEVTNTVATQNKRVVTTLVASQLDPKSAAFFGVTKNCAATSLAIASSISVPGSFSNHNTAYGVVGTYPNFSLNGQPNGLNICTPDTLKTRADLAAYLNGLKAYTDPTAGSRLVP